MGEGYSQLDHVAMIGAAILNHSAYCGLVYLLCIFSSSLYSEILISLNLCHLIQPLKFFHRALYIPTEKVVVY